MKPSIQWGRFPSMLLRQQWVPGAILFLVAAGAVPVAPRLLSAGYVPHIVNGNLTHDYPAVGAVLRGDFANWNQHIPITADNAGMFCSGTLIGCRTFLTAGHCTKTALPPGKLDADEAWVYLPHAGLFTVTSIALHPAYTLAGPNVPINDVAVLKLGAPVTGIAPMAINLTDPNPFIPASGTIVGFGNTGGVGAVDKGIKRVGHVETTNCLPDLSPDPGTQLVCWDFLDPIGPPGENSDTCGGDSGGPLLVDLGSGPVIAGLTSSGTNAACLPPDHSFDANVYTYRDFILGELGADDTTTCGGLPPVGDPQVEVVGFDGRLDEATPSVTHEVAVATGKNSVRFGLNALETLLRTAAVRTFDVNMYVKAGPGASPSDFDCKADAASVFAACVFDLPAAATYSVFLQRVIGAGDYELTATVFGGAPPECGNGSVEFNEQCDDGNTADGDCCAADCRFEPQGSSCGTAGTCDGAGQCVVAPCSGDCDGDDEVTVDELLTMVNIALETEGITACSAGDADGDGSITIDEIIRAVNAALGSCAPRACGGIAGLPCPSDEVCDLRDSTCAIVDLAGVCVPRPGACPEIYDPVCGCDGVTYSNECFRLSAGATLAHGGACP